MAVDMAAANGAVPAGIVNFTIDGSANQPYQLSGVGHAQFSRAFTVGTSHTVTVAYAGDVSVQRLQRVADLHSASAAAHSVISAVAGQARATTVIMKDPAGSSPSDPS